MTRLSGWLTLWAVSESATSPVLSVTRWLAQHARFPASRLAPHAEVLLLLTAIAARDEEAERARFALNRRDPAKDSALRAHALRRSLAHYKCDNSAKV